MTKRTVVTSRRSRTVLRAGFSMMDLVITMMIIGILAGVTAPRFADWLHTMRAEAAARRIKADLAYVRQTAISQSTTLSVSFVPASNSYSIPGLADLNRRGQTYAVALDAAPYQSRIFTAALGGDSTIQFNRFGQPDSGGTITVQSGNAQKTVSVDSITGKASIP